MKTLREMTNLDKAVLLHTLFPEAMPKLIDFIAEFSAAIREDQERNRKHWDGGFMSFDYWLSLIVQVEVKIKRYGPRLTTSSKVFSDQLFENYLALYTNHAISTYVKVIEHPNPKFTMAVELIFNPAPRKQLVQQIGWNIKVIDKVAMIELNAFDLKKLVAALAPVKLEWPQSMLPKLEEALRLVEGNTPSPFNSETKN